MSPLKFAGIVLITVLQAIRLYKIIALFEKALYATKVRIIIVIYSDTNINVAYSLAYLCD